MNLLSSEPKLPKNKGKKLKKNGYAFLCLALIPVISSTKKEEEKYCKVEKCTFSQFQQQRRQCETRTVTPNWENSVNNGKCTMYQAMLRFRNRKISYEVDAHTVRGVIALLPLFTFAVFTNVGHHRDSNSRYITHGIINVQSIL